MFHSTINSTLPHNWQKEEMSTYVLSKGSSTPVHCIYLMTQLRTAKKPTPGKTTLQKHRNTFRKKPNKNKIEDTMPVRFKFKQNHPSTYFEASKDNAEVLKVEYIGREVDEILCLWDSSSHPIISLYIGEQFYLGTALMTFLAKPGVKHT